MYRQLLKLLLSLLLLPLAAVAVPGASAAGDDGAKAKPAAKAPETISRDYQKEIDLLRAAADKLAAVNSEESAKDVSRKLSRDFHAMPPLVTGNEKEIIALSEARNAVSRHMMRLKKEEWFVSSGLQDAWTLMTDAFSRRRANTPGQRRMRIPRNR